jgi:hydrogenase large subunit
MATIVIDPLTRIEGHLRVELETDGGVIVRARSAGTSFRGLENVLHGRDPRDAAHITQRICGVCPIPHARAACEAFEHAAGVAVNEQARLIRNIVQAANFIDSHLLHFYALALPDYVAGLPTAGAWPQGKPPRAWPGGEGLDVAGLAEHAATSLQVRRACHEVIVALAGKMPHAAGIVPGGATVLLGSKTRADLRSLAVRVRSFVDSSYAADMQALAAAFPSYERLGASGVALLAYGGFPEQDGRLLLPGGLLAPGSRDVVPIEPSGISESTASARYARAAPAHPANAPTEPALDRTDAYSWIKAPRLAGNACEVGPLARAVLSERDPGSRGVMARHRARQTEASLLAASLRTWLAQLSPGASALAGWPDVPAGGAGAGLTEAPRGALGHWMTIERSRVSHYGVVSPTTWNASPRDDSGSAGPLERALQGVALADAADPIEAVRVVHSFDPCLQCAVH